MGRPDPPRRRPGLPDSRLAKTGLPYATPRTEPAIESPIALTRSRIPFEISLRKLPSGASVPANANRAKPIAIMKRTPMTFRTGTGYAG